MSKQVDLDSLRLLLLVGEHGSLGVAAAHLGISQPAASARLRSLESRYSLNLVMRSARGSFLTEDGKAVCGWARAVMNEVDVLESGITALSLQRSANLSIASSLTIAEYLLPRWIGELQRTAPGATAGLVVANSEEVIDLVRKGRVRIGFIEGPVSASGLTATTVGHDRIVVIVNPDHEWARRKSPIDRALLASTPLVLREPGSGTRATFDRALGSQPKIAMEAGSTSALLGSVLSGIGPGAVSEIAARAAIESGTLVEVATDLDTERPLRAIWSSRQRLTSPASDLVEIATGHQPG